MDFKRYSSTGFVLARRNYGEADRILKLFTPDKGKVTLLAKGVRKVKSRKRGSVEVFSRIRFSVSVTKGFDIITETVAEDLCIEVRNDLRRTSVAFYFVEIVDKISAEGEKHEQIYDLLIEFFDRLKTAKSLKTLRLEFVYRVLVSLGYWPMGKSMKNADQVLENVLERKINSVRVGKAVLG